MQLIAFILIYPILWLISLLPFRFLYALSDAVCFILYRLVGYRKHVVKSNLRLVFPEKNDAEINSITKKFYSHLCDLFLEMIKTLSISKSELKARFKVKNIDTLLELEKENTSVVLLYGHYASYEWSIVIQSLVTLPGLGVYKRIANPYFDKLAHKIRSKYNTELVATKHVVGRLEELHKAKDHRMMAFISDQSPKLKPNNVWLPFMGIEIPCFIGAEITAKNYNYPVGCLKIDKVKRGHYVAEIVTITKDPNRVQPFEITKTFNSVLEAQIKERPELYLWTHKRWKHKDEAPMAQTI